MTLPKQQDSTDQATVHYDRANWLTAILCVALVAVILVGSVLLGSEAASYVAWGGR